MRLFEKVKIWLQIHDHKKGGNQNFGAASLTTIIEY